MAEKITDRKILRNIEVNYFLTPTLSDHGSSYMTWNLTLFICPRWLAARQIYSEETDKIFEVADIMKTLVTSEENGSTYTGYFINCGPIDQK